MTRNAMLTAEQTATRLGVKLETVYAYVSRGALARTLADDLRTSRFDAREVDALARRGRPRKGVERVGAVDVSLATEITWITQTELFFRGRDATALASTSSFENVCELLWTGDLPSETAWPEPKKSIAVARSLCAHLPRGISPIERFSVVCAALAPLHPLRGELRSDTVIQHGRALLLALVASLGPRKKADDAGWETAPPAATSERVATTSKGLAATSKHAAATSKHPVPTSKVPATTSRRPARAIARRLWPALSPLPPTEPRIALLDGALVLLADHELATSTVAARVAASTRANPFAVVQAGLGALNGPLHGKAPLRVHELLLDAAASSADVAVARATEWKSGVPGFGHPVYLEGDPRARFLFAALAPLSQKRERTAIDATLSACSALGKKAPNVDFALAALAFACHMPLGATEAIFALARTAGFIAHAMEEYGEEPLRFRARAIYIGRA